MVEGLLLSVLVAGGLFKLVLCGSVLVDNQLPCGGSDGWRWHLAACCSSWCWYH